MGVCVQFVISMVMTKETAQKLLPLMTNGRAISGCFYVSLQTETSLGRSDNVHFVINLAMINEGASKLLP
jgi:hypothetical protein